MAGSIGKFVGALWLIGAALTTGCAFDITDVKYSPAVLQLSNEPDQTFVLTEDIRIARAPCWYARTLRQKTRWELIGRIAQGEVFRSKDQTLTVECSNIFEAYPVVSKKYLVGFYLPVEKGFVPISSPMPLPIE